MLSFEIANSHQAATPGKFHRLGSRHWTERAACFSLKTEFDISDSQTIFQQLCFQTYGPTLRERPIKFMSSRQTQRLLSGAFS